MGLASSTSSPAGFGAESRPLMDFWHFTLLDKLLPENLKRVFCSTKLPTIAYLLVPKHGRHVSLSQWLQCLCVCLLVIKIREICLMLASWKTRCFMTNKLTPVGDKRRYTSGSFQPTFAITTNLPARCRSCHSTHAEIHKHKHDYTTQHQHTLYYLQWSVLAPGQCDRPAQKQVLVLVTQGRLSLLCRLECNQSIASRFRVLVLQLDGLDYRMIAGEEL